MILKIGKNIGIIQDIKSTNVPVPAAKPRTSAADEFDPAPPHSGWEPEHHPGYQTKPGYSTAPSSSEGGSAGRAGYSSTTGQFAGMFKFRIIFSKCKLS